MRSRHQKVRPLLKKNRLDVLLVTSPANIQYLTGFELLPPLTREAYTLISQDQVWLLTDGRYIERARKLAGISAILLKSDQSILKFLNQQAQTNNWQTLAFEKDFLTFAEYEDLQKELKLKLVPTQGLIARLREIKSQEELDLITNAAQITDLVFQKLTSSIHPGISEHEVEILIRSLTAQVGGDRQAFIPIVAAGKHSAIPHHINTNDQIKKDDLLLIDFGVHLSGYGADLTRIIFFAPPTPKQKIIYNLVLQAQETALKEIKPGMTGEEADAIARKMFSEAGYPDHFPHSLGHSVGIYVHDGFRLCPKSKVVLEPGMVFTIEPGVYLPGEFGIRIEDLVVLEKDRVRTLTQTPKEICVLN